jgi:hypothetical protein
MTDDDFLLKELEKLKDIPPLPPDEQEVIEALGKAMAEQAFEDEAQGILHKPEKHKK